MQIRASQSNQTRPVTGASITKLDRLPALEKQPQASARFGIFYNTNKGMRAWVFLLIAVIVMTAAGGAYVIWHGKQATDIQGASSTEEINALLEKVGMLIELPQGETPTVATVSDKDKLKDQPFFANAQNGDKVIIYPNAKKAILYRPSINKLIDVAPVSFGDQPTVN